MNSNKEFYEKNLENGDLNSTVKDGLPKTKLEKILALGYPVVITISILITVILSFNKKLQWKIVGPVAAISTFVGWFWGIYILKYDPNYPSWIFLPWAIVGPEWLLTLEDWVFYPTFGILFCMIYMLIPSKGNSRLFSKWICFGILVVTTLFFCSRCAIAGKSITWFFSLPAVIMFLLVLLLNIEWNVKHYLIIGSIIVGFASIWDWAAVSWIHYIPGFAWCQHWVYISFDATGVAHHSCVFLPYNTCRWAWIFDNPIEITPWFGIAGWNYIYSCLLISKHVNRD